MLRTPAPLKGALGFIKSMVDQPITLTLEGSLGISFAIYGLEEYVEYHTEMEKVLAAGQAWRIASVEKQASKLPERERRRFIAMNRPHRWEQSFPDQLRATAVIAALSYFEKVVISIAADAARRSQTPWIPPTQGRLAKAKSFIGKTGGLRRPCGQDWKHVLQLQALRNHLVHNALYLHESNIRDSTWREIKSIPGIVMDQDGDVTMYRELCDHTFLCLKNALQQFHDEVLEKWESSADEA